MTLAVSLLLVWTGGISAQIEVLTPAMVEKLESAKEKRLELAPSGDVARFLTAADEWQEAAQPLVLDINKDGVRDFVVLSMVNPAAEQRALIIHDWGDAPDAFGSAVFYLVLDAEGDVVEWAGQHELTPRQAPGQ